MSAVLAASSQAQVAASHPSNKIPTKSTTATTVPTPPPAPVVGGSDDCSTAAAQNAINGAGSYSVNNTGATSGAPLGNCGAIGSDVWFYYTASLTGIATVSTCGGIGGDSVLAIWNDGSPAGTCPTTQVLCLDDSCGLQTSVAFPVAAGQKFFIEMGGFASAQYSGTFTVNEALPATNDDCSMPTTVVGNGPHNFNTTTATTGAQGQTEAACNFFGTIGVQQDVWFTWVATGTSQFELSLCNGGASYDTKMAVYPGPGCPAAGSAIACNDDSCGLVSALCFSATAGNTYTIQIGGFGTGGGTGTFSFNPVASGGGGCAPHDDGTTENSVGLTAGGAMGWLVGYGAVGQTNTVSDIQTCVGTPLFPGGASAGPITLAVFDDPNDDGDPSDCILITSFTGTVLQSSVDTDVLQTFTLPSPVSATGVFFVGAFQTHAAGQFPAPLDQSGGGGSVCSAAPEWLVGDTSGTINLNTLTANNVPPQSNASVGLPGNWLLRITCSSAPGTPYCFGDGSGTACPCGNNSPAGSGAGCLNSLGTGGLLAATGTASISNDTLSLNGSGMPNGAVLYFQGTLQLAGGAGAVFGDGLRCAGGTVIRLGTKTNVGGSSSYPGGSTPISIKGSNVAGNIRDYQGWYRNAQVFCTSATFNLTNGIQITWAP